MVKKPTPRAGTGIADPGFNFRYDGNIKGLDNLSLFIDGGRTSLNGEHEVAGVTIAESATLGGTSRYTLASGSQFSNSGTLSPGNSPGTIEIVGDYVQTPTGRLYMELGPSGVQDTLKVSGTATLDGTLDIAPLPGWYSSTFQLSGVNLVQAATKSGDFSTVQAVAVSPTLNFLATSNGGGNINLAASRAANAYQRLARTANGQAVGATLDHLAAATPARAMQPLYQGLDFSALDGSGIALALEQLSPASYSLPASSFLRREHTLGLSGMSDLWSFAQNSYGSAWTPYANSYGNGSRQDTQGSTVGYNDEEYGLTLGARRKLGQQNQFSLGFQFDIAYASVRGQAPYTAGIKATSGGLAVNAAYAPNPRAGLIAYAGMHMGLNSTRLDRTIAVGDYQAQNTGQWTSSTGSATLGASYQWALSPRVSAGPLVALSYARTQRPGVTESGSDASRLKVSGTGTDALLSSVGVRASLETHLPKTGQRLGAYAQLTWDHQMLDRTVDTTASFVSAPGLRFTSRNTILARDAMGLQAGLTYHSSDTLRMGLEIGGQLLGQGYRNLGGRLSVAWRY